MNNNKEKNKIIKKNFNAKDPKWRIEAVIHDGSWYDIPKWAKMAKVTEEDIEDWINKYGQKLVKSEIDSYRVSYEDVIEWYDQEKIDIEESIVPGNFPPKLWANQTEIEAFIKAPRRRMGTVSMTIENKDILNKVVNILKGVGKVIPEEGHKYRAHGLSTVHMKNMLSKGLTTDEFNSLNIKLRSVLLQRELVDLPEEWLEKSIDFYARIFAPNSLAPAMTTIKTFLPDYNDRQSQILMWVITAMKKFDEKASVPFSGYLHKVLSHWPYNIPESFLGKRLTQFQRSRRRVLAEVNKANQSIISNEELSSKMNLSMEEYLTLNEEYENWFADFNSTTLNWEDSANEKQGVLVNTPNSSISDISLMSKISVATVKAAVDTEEWDSAYTIIFQIDKEEIAPNLKENLNLEFINKFTKYLRR